MEATTVPKPKASEKTILLYKKNLRRVLDAGLSLKNPKEVITWLNTVTSKNKKPFSTATKRNILTAILYHKNLIKGVEGEYQKQQDEYNKELFSKYEKQGTINPEKTKAKQEGFGQKEYDQLTSETEFKDLSNEYKLGDNVKYYGYFAGKIVKERMGDTVLKGAIAKAMNLLSNISSNASVATKNRLPIYILYRLFYEYNFRNEIGNLKIVFDDKKPENVKDQNIIFIDKKTYEVTIIRTMYKTKDKYGLVETKIQDEPLQVHILALALKQEYLGDPKYPETGDVDESVERKKWTPSRLVQNLDKADGDFYTGDDVHYNGAEWDNNVSKLLPNGDLVDVDRPVFTFDGWMKYFSNKQQFYLRESKAVDERYQKIVVTKKKSSLFDKSEFTFFQDMPEKTLKDYGFSKTTQVSYSISSITPNFMYKKPFIQNDFVIVARGEYLFGKSLDSSAVGGIVRNAGLKYVKHPVAPTDIVKLSNAKYTEAVKEMLEKSKNRGHSIGTHTLIYIPK